jgi:hypothetical protein
MVGSERVQVGLLSFGTVLAALKGTVKMTAIKILQTPAFWDKKVRIAILALATFVALC